MESLPAPLAAFYQKQAQAHLVKRRRASAPAEPSPFTNPDPVAWIEQHFRIPETEDHRMHLEPYQRRCLQEALATDENGDFLYSTIVWCDIKKSAKSTITAAVALWRAYQLRWGQVVLVANDIKQADSRVGYYLRRSIELNPALKEAVKIVRYNVTLPNHTTVEAVSIDPTGEAGGGADMVVFSELWGAHQQAQQRMWTEMTLSPLKYGRSFRWVETYAGFSGESPLLEQLYDNGVKAGEQPEWSKEFRPQLEVYINREARLFCLWNTVPRNPWQTPEYYTQEAFNLAPDEFRRVHRNEWVSSTSAFISPAWWNLCGAVAPPLEPGQPVILALDASISGDTFGVLMVSGRRGYRGAEHYSDAGFTDVRFANAWVPPKGGSLDYKPIEAEVRRLCAEFNVVELVLDPYQLYDMGTRLRDELVANVYFFSQGKERLVADKSLQDKIRDRRITHLGDAVLGEHVSNANARSEDSKLRIVKRSELLKIDLAVCLSMASDRLHFWNL